MANDAGADPLSPKAMRCPSMTGHDYFLAVGAIIGFEPTIWDDTHAYVVMSLPRKQQTKVLVPVSLQWLEERYYAIPRLCEYPRPSRFG